MKMKVYILIIFLLATSIVFSFSNINLKCFIQSEQSVDSSNIAYRNLQGVWEIDTSSNAEFEIRGDSVYYIEHQDKPLKWLVQKEKLIIYYDKLKVVDKIIKLTRDSLILKSEMNEISKYYKR